MEPPQRLPTHHAGDELPRDSRGRHALRGALPERARAGESPSSPAEEHRREVRMPPAASAVQSTRGWATSVEASSEGSSSGSWPGTGAGPMLSAQTTSAAPHRVSKSVSGTKVAASEV